MRIVLLVLLVGFFAHVSAEADSTIRTIDSPDKALSKALELTGFGKLTGLNQALEASTISSQVIMQDSVTPFLSEYISGRKAWRVELENITVELEKYTMGPQTRSFSVFLDEQTGQLFEMRSGSIPPGSKLTREASAEVGQLQLQGMTYEKYHGIPTESPRLNFIEALNSDLFVNPLSAKLLVVNLVLWSRSDSEPVPAWIIHLYGVGPLGNHDVNHIRYVIDANTGDWLEGISLPYPDSARKQRIRDGIE